MTAKLADTLRDCHIYGGLLLVGIGAYVQIGLGAGMLLLGALMWYMGVHRMGPRKR